MPAALDIAVCGCGPAGLSAALLLHRAGHHVRIYERFAAPRPLGSGLILQPTGLGVLDELGLLETITHLGARIERLFGRAVPSQRVVLDVRYAALGPERYGIAVHRAALFDALHDAVTAEGIEIVCGQSVTGLVRSGGRARLVTGDGAQPGTATSDSFDLVVDALGAHSPLAAGIARRKVLPFGALWVNVPWPSQGFAPDALEQRYLRASRMAGVLPIGQRATGEPAMAAFFWSLKRAHVAAWRERGVRAWKQEVAQLWPEAAPLLDGVETPEQVTFAQYDHFTASSPWSANLVHIGDAAHATSPQLGQGANMALLDSLALQRALPRHATLSGALREYANSRYWHVHLFQWASAVFTPFYQSDSRLLPVIRDWFTAPLSRLPVGQKVLARLVSGMTYNGGMPSQSGSTQ